MAERLKYRKNSDSLVSAVQLSMDFAGFSYTKWGANQKCERNDWLVDNGGDVYTVQDEYFRNNYVAVRPGAYQKIGEVWAEVAEQEGVIETIEGSSAYHAGDYLLFDRPNGGRGWAVNKQRFEQMYERLDDGLNLPAEQAEYLEQKLEPSIRLYRDKSARYKVMYYGLQLVALVCGVAITGVTTSDFTLMQALVPWLGGLSAIATGLLTLFKPGQYSAHFADGAFALNQEMHNFKHRIGRYKEALNPFESLLELHGQIEQDLREQLSGKTAAK